MRKQIISNLISSGADKFVTTAVQFLSSILLIRLLPREDYGIIGIVGGYFAFVNILNISLESIILRDHKKYDDNLQRRLNDFFTFNVIKSIFFLVLALAMSMILSLSYKHPDFIFAIFSITFILIADSLTSPLVLYSASNFDQKLVAKISIFRSTIGFLILSGLLVYPQLAYVALKDLLVSVLFVSIWFVVAHKKFNIKPTFHFSLSSAAFMKETFLNYSLWTHLSGVVTNIIYRSDALFLSLFVSLAAVGNYNIALSSANVANVMPMILGYQNSVALSNARNKEHAIEISNAFTRLSIYLGIVTLILFYLWGDLFLRIITGQQENSEIVFFMRCIVTGLVIAKTFASPLVAYLTIWGDVVRIVKFISLPMFVVTTALYFIAAMLFNARGVAIANILVGLIWVVALFGETSKLAYKHNNMADFISDLRTLIRGVRIIRSR